LDDGGSCFSFSNWLKLFFGFGTKSIIRSADLPASDDDDPENR